jgi:hypothetical protein
MERQLDPNQSGQVYLDGGGPFSPEEPLTSVENDSETNRQDNSTQKQPETDSEDVTELKRDTIDGTQKFEEIDTKIDHNQPVEGTHLHIRNCLKHFCSNTPFANFFHKTFLYIDRRSFVQNEILKIINRDDYIGLDLIITIFRFEKISLFNPLVKRFSQPTALALFNVEQSSTFHYPCLTLADCEMLRKSIISKFQINPCECERLYCLDVSKLVPARKRRFLPVQKTTATTDTIEDNEQSEVKQHLKSIYYLKCQH